MYQKKERYRIMTENEIKVLKMNLLGGMHDYMMNVVQDEDLQEEWLSLGVPDGADEEDLAEIAEDAQGFAEIVRLFGLLVGDIK